MIRRYGELLSEEYQEDGIHVKAYVPAEWFAYLIGRSCFEEQII